MADTMADTVLYEVSDGLATITINRPEAMNAMNTETKVALRDALQAAAADDRRTGRAAHRDRDRAFCVGQDLKEHVGHARRRPASRGTGNTHEHRAASTTTRSCGRITEMPKPVVAGGQRRRGRGRASASRSRADYRVVADTAVLQHLVRRGRPDRRLGRLLDAAPADRPRAAPPICCSSRARSRRRRRTSWASRTGWCPPPTWPPRPRRWPARWPRGRRVAYAALKESLAYGAGAHAGARRWTRRTSSRRGRARRRTTRSRCRRSSPRRSRSTWAGEPCVAPSAA